MLLVAGEEIDPVSAPPVRVSCGVMFSLFGVSDFVPVVRSAGSPN